MLTITRLLIATALMLAASAGPAVAENSVTQWSLIAQNAVVPGRPPGSGQVLMGIVHVAIYDAVVAIEGRFEPFAVRPSVKKGASVDAAVATAAYEVAKARVPAQEPSLTAQYTAYMAGLPANAATAKGVAVGHEVATGILALRAGDGFDNVVPYIQPPIGPGVWEPTAPTPPVDVKLVQVQPLAMPTPWYFRPSGPNALSSRQYARDVAQVRLLGSIDSPVRTAERSQIVQFWADNGVAQWNGVARALAIEDDMSPLKTAYVLAAVNVVTADALIGCFEAKYYYGFWRPVHAIRRADTDGNPKTEADPAWSSVLNVNHPEYPSGHACLSGGMVETLEAFFGGRRPISISSAVTGTTSHYARIRDAMDEVMLTRIDAGLHFRKSMEDGLKLARRVSKYVLKRHFKARRNH